MQISKKNEKIASRYCHPLPIKKKFVQIGPEMVARDRATKNVIHRYIDRQSDLAPPSQNHELASPALIMSHNGK